MIKKIMTLEYSMNVVKNYQSWKDQRGPGVLIYE